MNKEFLHVFIHQVLSFLKKTPKETKTKAAQQSPGLPLQNTSV